MHVRDLDSSQIESILVDRTEDGVKVPHVYEGGHAMFVAFMGHHELTKVGRLLAGPNFRIILKPQSPRQVAVAAGMSASSAALGLLQEAT